MENNSFDQCQFELALSFHKQFAENQNHHQNVLFKLAGLLVSVIVGYGYILFENKGGNDFLKAGMALAGAEGLLLVGLILTYNMAYGFRRDQLVNYKIRKKYGIIAKNDNEDSIFPSSYNPMYNYFDTDGRRKKEIKNIDWMPEFHKIFVYAFFSFQCLLLLAFL